MAEFAWAFSWGTLVFLAFAGWGWLATRLLFAKEKSPTGLLSPNSFRAARTANILEAAIYLATVCSLKTTWLPNACVFTAAAFIFAFISQKQPRFLVDALTVGLAALLAMAPWMLWQPHNAGALLYPVLGNGYDGHNLLLDLSQPSAPPATQAVPQ